MTKSPSPSSGVCHDCQSPLLVKSFFGLFKSNKSTPCENCDTKQLCQKCAGKHALIPMEDGKDPPPLEKDSIKSYCNHCFQQVSILDYSKSYDVIEPTSASNNITLLWVHGGGSSRAMFRPHARNLASKGYRSILMDLPGLGTLVDSTTLTLDECVVTAQNISSKENCQPSQTVYIGASLGAYVGFHILNQLKTKFASAVLMDCGQNVGPDCSLKARIGLWFMSKVTGYMSNKSIMESMMKTTQKSKADYHIVECCFASGMSFDQGRAQCHCLHSVEPAKIIPSLDFPILFFNGSEDYRDSEDKWLSLCQDKKLSELKVYEGGDHFFCHDSRFVDDMLERIDKFAKLSVSG